MCQIDKKKYKMNSWKRKGTAGNLMFKLRDEKTKERTIQSGGKRRVPLGQPPPQSTKPPTYETERTEELFICS